MENGKISLKVFAVLDQIRSDHKIKVNEWAVASFGHKKCQSRISELRRKLRLLTFAEEDDVGRAFSSAKCMALLNGLKNLIGEDKLSKELKKVLDKAESDREELLLLVMMLKKEDLKHTLMYLRQVALKEEQ